MINLFEKKEGCNFWKKNKEGKPALLTRICPPGLALEGPDMSKVRVLVQSYMFWVQNLFFEEISRWFCMVFRGEAQKTRFWDQQPWYLTKNVKNMFWFCDIFYDCWSQNRVFWASTHKIMQNHYENTSKS